MNNNDSSINFTRALMHEAITAGRSENGKYHWYISYRPASRQAVKDLIELCEQTLREFPSDEQYDAWIEDSTQRYREEQRQKFNNAPKRTSTTKATHVGHVYLMHDTVRGFHKIGFATDPKFREKTLQAEVPSIVTIHSFEGTMLDEEALHIRFRKKRLRGEWFQLAEEDVNYILSL